MKYRNQNRKNAAPARAKCRRICGDDSNCEVTNKRQLECFTETVMGEAQRISDTLIRAYTEQDREKVLQNIDKALSVADDLASSMRFLRLTGDLGNLSALQREAEQERRNETRYLLPEPYREHIGLKVDHSGSFQQASLLNFSQSGVQFQCATPPPEGGYLNCVLTTSLSPDDNVSFRIKVKYIMEQERGFIVGGRVEEVSRSTAVNLCRSIFDFMMELSIEGPPRPEASSARGEGEG